MNTQNKEPNIRFNQFKELWKVVKLDSISQKVKTKNINNTFENVLTNSAEFGIIPQRDFFDKSIANLKNLNGYYVVQPNDFVYNPRISNKAPVGPIKANFLNSTGVMSPLYYVFRTQNVDVFFLAKYFDTSYWHKFMKLNGDTGARSDRFAIKDSVFKKMPIPFPSLPEQSAIGSLFRTLDDLLASYKDNLANYQSLTATQLSKMFPKAGETVPEIRLDGFEGEWDEKRLKDISKRVTRKNNDLVSERALTISAQFGLIDQEEFFQKKIASKDVSGYYLIKKGEFAYNKSYSTGYPLGAIKRLDKYENGVLSTLYILFKAVDVDSDYLAHYYESDKWHREVSMCAAEGARNHGLLNIAPADFFNTRLVIPKELEEQQAIGSYFSNLDNLINSHQEKISQLETLKKKLLQDMFI